MHAQPTAGKLTGEARRVEDGLNCSSMKASPNSLLQARAHGTQREIIRMESPLLISFALVFLVFICSGPLRISRGDRQWWSCSQGQPPWIQNDPLRITSKKSIPLLNAAAESSSSDLAFCLWSIRSVRGIHPVKNLVSTTAGEVWVGNWIHSVEVENCRLGESPSGVRRVCVSHSSVGSSFWVHSSPQAFPLNPQFVSLVIPLSRLNMAPRRRGTPRRGRNSGFRGGSGGWGSSEPRRISPLAMASPSSPPSDKSGPSLNSSLHSARFTFKSRLNRPLISTLVTVIFSEEEDDLVSSVPASMDDSPSQSRGVEDVVKVSTELHEEDGQEEDSTQRDSRQENIIQCEPVKSYENILHLRSPPDGNLMEVEDGVMVTWERAPDQVNENVNDEPK